MDAGSGRDVDTVIVDGVMLVQGGRATRVDEAMSTRRARPPSTTGARAGLALGGAGVTIVPPAFPITAPNADARPRGSAARRGRHRHRPDLRLVLAWAMDVALRRVLDLEPDAVLVGRARVVGARRAAAGQHVDIALGRLAARLESATNRRVDLVLLDEAPAPLAYRVFGNDKAARKVDGRFMADDLPFLFGPAAGA